LAVFFRGWLQEPGINHRGSSGTNRGRRRKGQGQAAARSAGERWAHRGQARAVRRARGLAKIINDVLLRGLRRWKNTCAM
jgi:hypothetical protein